MLQRRYTLLIGLCIVAALIASYRPTNTHAYRTAEGSRARWSNRLVNFTIQPGMDRVLGINDAAGQLRSSLVKWNRASRFNFAEDSSGMHPFAVANFQTFSHPQCGFFPDVAPAATCVKRDINVAGTWFNTSGSWRWNTTGTIDNPNIIPAPWRIDFNTVAIHEIGHWYTLDHDCWDGNAVMCVDYRHKPNLSDDDRQGATQMYGPWTGWEDDQALGLVNNIYYSRSVTGYFNSSSPPPEFSQRPGGDFGVPAGFAAKYVRMAGYAQNSYSYVYFRIFASENESGGRREQNYVVIMPGMKLKWFQYNYQQSTMMIDFETTDGRTLRDSGLKDLNGISVHPSARGVYPTGKWLTFEVDLTPLAGKTIRKWMAAYDNGGNGKTGQFRGYFDGFRLEW